MNPNWLEIEIEIEEDRLTAEHMTRERGLLVIGIDERFNLLNVHKISVWVLSPDFWEYIMYCRDITAFGRYLPIPPFAEEWRVISV